MDEQKRLGPETGATYTDRKVAHSSCKEEDTLEALLQLSVQDEKMKAIANKELWNMPLDGMNAITDIANAQRTVIHILGRLVAR